MDSQNKVNVPNAELAIADIEFIRTILENDERNIPDRTELAIHMLVTGAALVMLFAAWFFFPNFASDLLQTATNEDLRAQMMWQAGVILAIVAIGVYALAYLRARELQSTLSRTLNRHFEFLKAESFLPDLALKAFVLVILVQARQPQYIAAVLTAFTADYALQGRFFRLSRVARIIAGLALYALAITSSNILIATGAFAVVSLASTIAVVLKRAKNG